jgi:hypothetical protein
MIRTLILALALAATAVVLAPAASAGHCAYFEQTLEDATGMGWQVGDTVCVHPNSPYCGGHHAVFVAGTGFCTRVPPA